ncbi:MAG: hypothetical protein IJ865_08130, partial [Clostridia bacterium]|nr:hypothetical protein [Clostridia bacterium]
TTATFQPDGAFVFDFETYSIQEVGTWTFEDGKLTVTNPDGLEAVAEGDPLLLHYVSAASEMLTGDYEVPVSALSFDSAAPAETVSSAEPAVIPSTDGGTTATFQPDGAFVFDFETYSIQEVGTWTFEDGKLTVVNPNGLEAVAEGDPLLLHYVSAASDMLTGDYEVPVSALHFDGSFTGVASEPATTPENAEVTQELTVPELPADSNVHTSTVTVPNVDSIHETEMSFLPDGTYRFWFPEYTIEDLGTWTYVDGTLTMIDANGKDYVSSGDPLSFTYCYSMYEALSSDYLVPAFIFSEQGTAAASVFDGPVTLANTDDVQQTEMTFTADGTYRFWFPEYTIEDLGSWTYEDGILTLTDANEKSYQVEGDPLQLHYCYSMYDALSSDYSIPAATFLPSVAKEKRTAEITVTGENRPADLDFRKDGTYFFHYDQYGLEEEGRYSCTGEELTLVNAKGVASTAEGNPFILHYQTAISSMLVIDYTVPADVFERTDVSESSQALVIPSDDENEHQTELTLNPDGTYRYWFPEYTIEDLGTWTFDGGVLKLTDANGKEYTAEGNPLKLHYAYSLYEALTGDYTFSPDLLPEVH